MTRKLAIIVAVCLLVLAYLSRTDPGPVRKPAHHDPPPTLSSSERYTPEPVAAPGVRPPRSAMSNKPMFDPVGDTYNRPSISDTRVALDIPTKRHGETPTAQVSVAPIKTGDLRVYPQTALLRVPIDSSRMGATTATTVTRPPVPAPGVLTSDTLAPPASYKPPGGRAVGDRAGGGIYTQINDDTPLLAPNHPCAAAVPCKKGAMYSDWSIGAQRLDVHSALNPSTFSSAPVRNSWDLSLRDAPTAIESGIGRSLGSVPAREAIVPSSCDRLRVGGRATVRATINAQPRGSSASLSSDTASPTSLAYVGGPSKPSLLDGFVTVKGRALQPTRWSGDRGCESIVTAIGDVHTGSAGLVYRDYHAVRTLPAQTTTTHDLGEASVSRKLASDVTRTGLAMVANEQTPGTSGIGGLGFRRT